MNEQEKEINLKRLFYKALKHWRVAAVVAMVGAVVIGGTKCTMELVKLSDPETIEERQIEYQGELATYQQKGEAIRKSIESIEDSLVQQTDYNENSVLMEIDPYNEWNGSIDFYVETDWQIMPDMTVQNQNPANQIVRVYSTYISNGELYQYVLERLETTMEIRYLREVMSGAADASNFLIHFTVKGTTQEECQTLLKLIEEGMRAKQPEIVSSVGEFKLLTTNNSTYSQINYDLEQSQKNNLQAITDLNTSLTTKQFEQLEWKRDEKKIEVPVLDKMDAVKEGIKWAILSGVIFGVVVLLYFGIKYILSKYVQDRGEFEDWGVYVAELPASKKSDKKRAFAGIDRLIGKWFLGTVYRAESGKYVNVAAKQIAETAKLTYETKEPKLVLVGDVAKVSTSDYAVMMNNEKVQKEVCFLEGGNPLVDYKTIDTIREADGVVLVVEQDYTTRESVYCMRKMLEDIGKQPVAVLLTEADAID